MVVKPYKTSEPGDMALCNENRGLFERAYRAAWILLSEDRRFLGAPTFKDLICEIAALRALGSETTIHKKLRDSSDDKDPNGVNMILDGYGKACEVAKAAIHDNGNIHHDKG